MRSTAQRVLCAACCVFGIVLTPSAMARLGATQELQLALGPNADLWQGVVDGVQTGRVR